MIERAREVVVDASNLAHLGVGTVRRASWAHLRSGLDAVRRTFPGALLIPILEPSIWHRLVDRADFDRDNQGYGIVMVPAGIDMRSDGFLLREADERGAPVVSNDAFKEHHATYPWLVGDEVRVWSAVCVAGTWRIDPRRLSARATASPLDGRETFGDGTPGGEMSGDEMRPPATTRVTGATSASITALRRLAGSAAVTDAEPLAATAAAATVRGVDPIAAPSGAAVMRPWTRAETDALLTSLRRQLPEAPALDDVLDLLDRRSHELLGGRPPMPLTLFGHVLGALRVPRHARLALVLATRLHGRSVALVGNPDRPFLVRVPVTGPAGPTMSIGVVAGGEVVPSPSAAPAPDRSASVGGALS